MAAPWNTRALDELGDAFDLMTGRPMDPLDPETDFELELLEHEGNQDGPKPLGEDEVKHIVAQEIQHALGGLESELSEQRRLGLRSYFARPFGNEVEGRSQVVLSDVRDCVEWIMPSLVRMLIGGEYTVRYKPTRPQDEAAAKQATEYVKYVMEHEADSYTTLCDWIKTALIEKNGFVIAYNEETTEPRIEQYRGLEEVQVMMLADDGYEILAADTRTETWQTEQGPVQVELWDVQARRVRTECRLRIDGIPPEEYLHARRYSKLDDRIPFCGRRRKVTVSDLIAMGYSVDRVWDLPSDDMPEFNTERIERRLDEESYPFDTADRLDGASREVWLTECFIRIDEDGDGYAELRKITVVGDTAIEILDDELVNSVPICSLTPVPVPHKFFGQSIPDLVSDLQIIRSTLLRQMLDNLYLLNNQRHEVVEDFVNVNDLLDSRPGGIVRVQEPGMVKPLEQQPLPPQAFQMMEWLETIKENRTGILRHANGMDANVLHETSSGLAALMGAAQARVELIARNFAQTGFKRLGKVLLRLLKESPVKERVVKLRGEWITIDPSTWADDMDVEVEVGLGVGQANERIQQLGMLLDLQKQAASSGMLGKLVTPDHIHRSLEKITEAMGFTPGLFFQDPQGQMPDPPPPPEQVQVAQLKSEMDKLRLQLEEQRLQLDVQKESALAEHRELDRQTRAQLERAKIESDERIAMRKLDCECQIEREKIAAAKAAPEKEAA